jgi:hypothetical protein
MMRLLVSIGILALVGSVSTAYVDHDGALDTARLTSTVPLAALAVAVLAALGHRVTARR